MGGDAATGFVGYPMVEEAEATGVVAGVYAGLLESMPFVPSLFKSLALCPGYLVLAHEQVVPVLPDPSFGCAAQQLVASVWNVATPADGRRGPGGAGAVRRPAEPDAPAGRRPPARAGR
jgi:hypothetical protein